MTVLETLEALLDDGSDVLYECRRCGERCSATTDRCPRCGSTEVARYEW